MVASATRRHIARADAAARADMARATDGGVERRGGTASAGGCMAAADAPGSLTFARCAVTRSLRPGCSLS